MIIGHATGECNPRGVCWTHRMERDGRAVHVFFLSFSLFLPLLCQANSLKAKRSSLVGFDETPLWELTAARVITKRNYKIHISRVKAGDSSVRNFNSLPRRLADGTTAHASNELFIAPTVAQRARTASLH